MEVSLIFKVKLTISSTFSRGTFCRRASIELLKITLSTFYVFEWHVREMLKQKNLTICRDFVFYPKNVETSNNITSLLDFECKGQHSHSTFNIFRRVSLFCIPNIQHYIFNIFTNHNISCTIILQILW